ncbi:MAG: glutamate--tRNA ligase family protein [Myxococcota bacterium]
MIGRFAPSTTGPAHPGTLLAALLCWLDARSVGGKCILRLEDLDPDRSRAEWSIGMERDLEWLGLDFDARVLQSGCASVHEAALDRLERDGRLYPCTCSRSEWREGATSEPGGGLRYPGTCRARTLPSGGWRRSEEPLRVRLEPGREYGDPVVRRRDGAVAYHLAAVVDDAESGVTRVVRGHDLEATTGLQNELRDLLGLSRPEHRHHLLLLEERGEKLAKLHGAVGLPELRAHYRPDELCGWLARAAGLIADAADLRPIDLVPEFAWEKVGAVDRIVRWQPPHLVLVESGA